MKSKITDFTREEVKAMAQSGMVGIKSVDHWDVCNLLKQGKTMEIIAEQMRMSFWTVVQIKKTKCPNC